MPPSLMGFNRFCELADSLGGDGAGRLVPLSRCLMSDHLTPVLAYRRLVRPDQRMAPSFLLESVVGGDRAGRYSYLGTQPAIQVIARGHEVQVIDNDQPDRSRTTQSDDPLGEMHRITESWRPAKADGLADFTGGWVGFVGYDAARYQEPEKLSEPPPDDRGLPELHMGLYRRIVAFDQAQKTVLAVTNVPVDNYASLREAYDAGENELAALIRQISTPPDGLDGQAELTVGEMDLDSPPPPMPPSNMGEGGYQQAVRRCKEYIRAGDAFQIVPSQRFELRTSADPFDIYRALRVVNPSPYMFYVQIDGAMLIGASPEILCQVHDGRVVNRPLAGTRRRGDDEAEDNALEEDLLADPKERAEHIMLVDLGRNDVGRICEPGSIDIPQLMAVERYSHVMHISSTVTGRLTANRSCWDALRSTLPVGTVSGAPKIRAMQIIDQLEPTKRGPYAGAVGFADLNGNMDMAIALRTMVALPSNDAGPSWVVHLQAGAGIVEDSDPDAEHQETVSKAAALAKAVHLAETSVSSPAKG